jgi:hypothetical protein
MSKPSIQNITTSQTFQNWFDKTNEMVDIMRDSAVTASVSGDTTTGDATILGEFTANTIVAVDELRMDVVSAATPGNTIQYDSPVEIIGATQSVVATFNYGAQGGRTRYTDGTTAWDTGFENSTTNSFLIKQGTGDPQFLLTTAGVLTVPSLTVLSEITFPTDANGAVTGTLSAANAEISGTLTVNIVDATRINCNDIRGQFTGDIYHPDGTKVFENGGPASNIPATFTGNVNGTVSSLTNHTTDGLAEGSTNLYFTTARVRGALTAGTGVGVIVDPNNSNKTLISIGQAVNTNSNVRFNTVKATGDITAFSSVSDIAMKENINPIENALDKVMQLGGYTFNYKNRPGEEMTGVMAQEIEKVLPGIVYETVDPETGKETYAVRHGNLVGLLIEAIKELSAKVGK